MGNKASSSSSSEHHTPETLQKVIFMQRILKFSCTDTLRVVELCQVHSTWRETIQDFSTAAIVWRDNFLGAEGTVPFKDSAEGAAPSLARPREVPAIADPDQEAKDLDERNIKALKDLRSIRQTFSRNGVAIAGKPSKDDSSHIHHEPVQQSRKENGINRNLQLIFFTAIEKQIIWVVHQLLQARIKQSTAAQHKLQHSFHLPGYYPVHIAIHANALASLEVLCEFSKQFHEDDGGFVDLDTTTASSVGHISPLQVAVKDKVPLRIVKYLIEKVKLDVNARTGNATNPATMASGLPTGVAVLSVVVDELARHPLPPYSKEPLDCTLLNYLLSVEGIDLNCEDPNNSHFTPLEFAVRKGHFQLAELLLQKGADPNHQSTVPRDMKRSCLHLSITYHEDKKNEFAKLLIKHGANPNLQESHGFTVLHIAVSNNRASLIEILLNAKSKYGGSHDADPSILDSTGQTARDFAVARIKHKGNKDYIAMAQAIPASSTDTKKFVDESELPTEEEFKKQREEEAAIAAARPKPEPEKEYGGNPDHDLSQYYR